MSRLKTISDKLDYIAMGKLNAEQMEYICEINQEVNLKDRKIERLHNIIKEVREYIESYINQFNGVYPPVDMRYLDLNKLLEMLDKEKV